MKRALYAVALAASCVAFACGDDSNPNQPRTPTTPATPTGGLVAEYPFDGDATSAAACAPCGDATFESVAY